MINSYIRLYYHYFTGDSPLHWAASEGHLEVTRMLLDADNIDINLQNRWGKYIFCISSQFMNISLLGKYGIKISFHNWGTV